MPMPGDDFAQGAAAPATQPNNEAPAGLADLQRELVAERGPQPYRTFGMREIMDIFSYHPPTPEQRETYEFINLAFQQCALKITTLLPNGPGKTAAMRKLADARMAANAAVALEGRF